MSSPLEYLASLVPDRVKPILRTIYHLRTDVGDRLTIARASGGLVPPRSRIFVERDDFLRVGREFRGYFIELAKLRPHEKVLDVGCGIGRMAVPLTEYLTPPGEYWGFDVVRRGIDWCVSRISSRFENFHFLHSDVYNKHYNPGGRTRAHEYRFPFGDGQFDFVFLPSVFTHMLPRDLEG